MATDPSLGSLAPARAPDVMAGLAAQLGVRVNPRQRGRALGRRLVIGAVTTAFAARAPRMDAGQDHRSRRDARGIAALSPRGRLQGSTACARAPHRDSGSRGDRGAPNRRSLARLDVIATLAVVTRTTGLALREGMEHAEDLAPTMFVSSHWRRQHGPTA